MEKAKQVGSSSSSTSSSFAVELFGPKETSRSSSTGHFGTIFGQTTSSLGAAKEGFGHHYANAKHGTLTDYVDKAKDASYEERGSKVEPCYFNSSIYYGGQEVYSLTNQNNNSSTNNFKKEGEHQQVDANESNSNCASRGNWWQGSLYY